MRISAGFTNATAIPAMDCVLLCVIIAFELKKDNWKNYVASREFRVRLTSIEERWCSFPSRM
jgi:hypothetical protein